MIGNERVLAIIPARGGSKGVPRKNLRLLGEKPLIAWTIEAAKGSRFLDRIIVSSDSPEILKTSREYGADTPFTRPPELASDTATTVDAVLHAIDQVPGYEWVVLLQPTSPLRTTEDIDGAIEHCISEAAPSCISIVESSKHPYWMYTLDKNGCLRSFLSAPEKATRRQDLPPIYVPNGAIYIIRVDELRNSRSFVSEKTIGFEIPFERSLDIDTEFDLDLGDWLLRRNSHH